MRILDGSKCWEIRSSRTTKRCVIALACHGHLLGEVELWGCKPVAQRNEHGELIPWGAAEDFLCDNFQCHRIPDPTILKYKRFWAWQLRNPKKYDMPIPYCHNQGAVTFVNLRPVPKSEPTGNNTRAKTSHKRRARK